MAALNFDKKFSNVTPINPVSATTASRFILAPAKSPTQAEDTLAMLVSDAERLSTDDEQLEAAAPHELNEPDAPFIDDAA